VLTNSGVIDSIGGSAIQTFASTLGSTIVNNGTIASRTTVLFLSTTANDTVINNGLIVGNSFFNGGNDFYDGRNGTSIGFVFGGDGNDTLFGGAGDDDLRGGSGNDFLLGGAGADNLDGGADFDFAMYNFGGAATVVLGNNALNGGAAAGDILTSIEGVTGSEFGDTIVGDGTANQLFGLGGSDAIAGGGGADIILGGAAGDILFGEAGADTITGGAGGDVIRGGIDSDTFVFGLGDNGDLYQQLNEGGALDKFDLRGYFDATGFAGTDPRDAGIMAIFQNGADADVYLYGGFAFRIAGVAAAAIDDSYFLFQ
jgi:Ca2+-binding RTX toxin-like protein